MPARSGRPLQPPSGHVFRVERKRGAVWYAKYRLPDGRQAQKKIGPGWSERGRPPAGYFTKRLAQEWLRETLDQARRGTLPGAVRTGARFEDATAEWLRYVEHDRAVKPSTLRHYRSTVNAHLLPAFRDERIEDITTAQIEGWRAGLVGHEDKPLSNRTRNSALSVLQSVLERSRKVFGLRHNPASEIEPLRERYDATRFSFYTPEQVHALVRAAADEQDGAIYLTAAFTGLRRGELVALRWQDIDFEREAIRVRGSYAAGVLTTPKSGKGRSVPMVPGVSRALAKLSKRDESVGDDDLVFPGSGGGYLDGSALRRRFVTAQNDAGLPTLRFHDLRHTFGTLAARSAESLIELKEWMGHAEIRTTQRYTHYREQRDAAQRLARAFEPDVVSNDESNSPANVANQD
jgi:integrase